MVLSLLQQLSLQSTTRLFLKPHVTTHGDARVRGSKREDEQEWTYGPLPNTSLKCLWGMCQLPFAENILQAKMVFRPLW